MSGICDTCKRMKCYMEHDGDDFCPLYLNGEPSNYKKLFGTPERAARTLYHSGTLLCRECLIREECTEKDSECKIHSYYELLEWLRGDAG